MCFIVKENATELGLNMMQDISVVLLTSSILERHLLEWASFIHWCSGLKTRHTDWYDVEVMPSGSKKYYTTVQKMYSARMHSIGQKWQ